MSFTTRRTILVPTPAVPSNASQLEFNADIAKIDLGRAVHARREPLLNANLFIPPVDAAMLRTDRA